MPWPRIHPAYVVFPVVGALSVVGELRTAVMAVARSFEGCSGVADVALKFMSLSDSEYLTIVGAFIFIIASVASVYWGLSMTRKTQAPASQKALPAADDPVEPH